MWDLCCCLEKGAYLTYSHSIFLMEQTPLTSLWCVTKFSSCSTLLQVNYREQWILQSVEEQFMHVTTLTHNYFLLPALLQKIYLNISLIASLLFSTSGLRRHIFLLQYFKKWNIWRWLKKIHMMKKILQMFGK